MCRVRAKILVARKLGREQKSERSGEGVGQRGKGSLAAPPPPCSFSFFALAPIFARPESRATHSTSFARERLLRRLCGTVCCTVQGGFNVKSVDETLVCDHSNESY